jgi:hypothetical protein
MENEPLLEIDKVKPEASTSSENQSSAEHTPFTNELVRLILSVLITRACEN